MKEEKEIICKVLMRRLVFNSLFRDGLLDVSREISEFCAGRREY